MNDVALSAALALCLGAGAVDLLALNVVVLPAARASLPRAPERETPARTPAPPVETSRTAELPAVSIAGVPARRAEPDPVAILEFDPASRRVDHRGSSALSQMLAQLRNASEIVVIGHADASGSEELNDRLSAQRAAAVARRLVESGVPSRRVRVDARGEREPRQDGNSRRVEIFVGGQP